MGKEKQISTPLMKRTWKMRLNDHKFVILAFFVPFLLMGIGFAVNGVSPFGDKMILVVDFWQQYFPFMLDFQTKMQEGSSLLYSWNIGLGTNYVALIAYYLASPLNLLFSIVPQEFLREYVTLTLIIKIGCAGGFMSIFLRSIFKRNDLSLVAFSSLYALCAFTMAYYWNVMWFDTFAVLPLLALGTISLVTRGKFKLFVIALGLSMFTNYYIGFFACIFVALVFFATCVLVKTPVKVFFKKLSQVAAFSVLGLALSAILVLPAYIALQNTFAVDSTMPPIDAFYDTHYTDALTYITDILAGFDAFATPAPVEGLPNVFCGFICVVLIGIYFSSNKIKLREKVVSIVLLAFFIFCCIMKLPNYIFHGMHIPNQLPYRFAFLISFIVIVMAYRAFMLLKDIKLKQIITSAVVGGIFVLFAFVSESAKGQYTDLTVNGSLALLVAYVALMLMYFLKIMPKKIMQFTIYALILVELCGSVFIGIDTVRVTDGADYPYQKSDINTIRSNYQEGDDELFYREAFERWYSVNDPAMYGYKGASLFSSTVDARHSAFMAGMGLLGWDIGNRYTYAETLPLSNSFLNIKYMIGRNRHPKDTNNWEMIEQGKGLTSYKNKYYLPLGFMTDSAMEQFDYKLDENGYQIATPFEAQQNLLTKATGVTGEMFEDLTVLETENVFTGVKVTQTGQYTYTYSESPHQATSSIKFVMQVPKDGVVYLYPKFDYIESVDVKQEGVENGTSETTETKRPFVFPVGTYKQGDKISVTVTVPVGFTSGNIALRACVLDNAPVDQAYALLNDETYDITQFDTTKIEGTITANKDGIMYTSIPYEEGWSVNVDGEPAQITPLANNGVCGVKLSAGTHTVTFTYMPSGFVLGVCVTLGAIAVLVVLSLLERRRRKTAQELITVQAEESTLSKEAEEKPQATLIEAYTGELLFTPEDFIDEEDEAPVKNKTNNPTKRKRKKK